MSRLVPGHTYRGYTYGLHVISDPDKGDQYIDEITDPDGRTEWLPWREECLYEVKHFEAMVDTGVAEARRKLRAATGHSLATPREVEDFLINSPTVIWGVPLAPHQIGTGVSLACCVVIALPFMMAVLP